MKSNKNQIKRVFGYKSMVINDLSSDIRSLYKEAKSKGMEFYVNVDGKLQSWGMMSVCDHLGIDDISKF